MLGVIKRRVRGSTLALCLSTVALGSALAAQEGAADLRWWAPSEGRTFPNQLDYENADGTLRVLLEGEPLDTAGHAFFEPIGPNGRACVTCHQPADSMSLSAASARAQWDATGGADPLFAAYDGSNCPTLPQGERASHSLLLDRGLFRIERQWPPARWNDLEVEPDFTIEVVRDPTGCNSGPVYGPENGRVSVYRRPRPVANMKYLLAVGFPYDPKQGLALPRDPETGAILSGNLMADNRASTLSAQMQDAAGTHLEFAEAMTPAQIAQVESFILRVYAAQQVAGSHVALDSLGANGGPGHLRDSEAGQLGSIGAPVWSEFSPWEELDEATLAAMPAEERELRASIARGARVFRERMFLISDTAGINSPMGFGNPVRNSCVFCHNMSQMGNDVAPGQVDLGTTNQPFADPAPHLPLFRITCTGEPHPHYGRVIYTSDPGFALTTGRCQDVGKITLQSMRGLAARAPYFSNGSAPDLRAVVDYYDRRYNIGYTEQEKQDLVNLMRAL